MELLKRFFLYFRDDEGYLVQYNDMMGKGFTDIRHLIWIIITILLVVLFIKLSKKYKDQVVRFFRVVLVFMFIQRLAHQIVRAVIMVESPFWRALTPAHLCTMMIYLLPIVVIFNIEKIKKPVYFFSVLGGVITILDGDYFSSIFMPFGTIEGMFAHTVLVVSSITLMYIEKEHFNLNDVKKIYIMMAIMTLWSTSLNMLLLYLNPVYDPNYLYLVKNMLPVEMGKYFIFIYLLVFTIIVSLTYLFNNLRNKEKIKKEISENKYKILTSGVLVIVYVYLLCILNHLFVVK